MHAPDHRGVSESRVFVPFGIGTRDSRAMVNRFADAADSPRTKWRNGTGQVPEDLHRVTEGEGGGFVR